MTWREKERGLKGGKEMREREKKISDWFQMLKPHRILSCGPCRYLPHTSDDGDYP